METASAEGALSVCLSVQKWCSGQRVVTHWLTDDVTTRWALKRLACPARRRSTGRAAAARRRAACRAKPPAISPSTSPISAVESGRRPPGRCCISADWTSGKMDTPVGWKLGEFSAGHVTWRPVVFCQTGCSAGLIRLHYGSHDRTARVWVLITPKFGGITPSFFSQTIFQCPSVGLCEHFPHRLHPSLAGAPKAQHLTKFTVFDTLCRKCVVAGYSGSAEYFREFTNPQQIKWVELELNCVLLGNWNFTFYAQNGSSCMTQHLSLAAYVRSVCFGCFVVLSDLLSPC